jgi:hypothetical protein
MRQPNFSLDALRETLKTEGHSLSPVTVSRILQDEGLARCPRR